jgi:hypothetical protein
MYVISVHGLQCVLYIAVLAQTPPTGESHDWCVFIINKCQSCIEKRYLSLLLIITLLQWGVYSHYKINTPSILFLLLPTPIPLSDMKNIVFHHIVIKIRQLFYDLPTCLLETGAGANDCNMKPGPAT